MNISKEAIEAAARAAYIADNLCWDGAEAAWDDMGGSERSFERAGWEIAARAALEAAAPLLMAQAWDEGELAGYENAKVEEWPLVAPNENPYRKEQS